MAGLAALLALLLVPAAQAQEISRLEGAAKDGLKLRAVIAKEGKGTSLKIFGGDHLIYTHPGTGEYQRFESVRIPGQIPDFFGDGTPTILYVSQNPAFGRSTLFVLRYQAPYFVRVGTFPEGRVQDLGHDEQNEIVAQDRPLGRFFSVSCGGFETTAAQAVSTMVRRWNGREFVSTGARFPDFWREREDADVAALVESQPKRKQKPGLYLSRALTVYFDEAAQDRKQAGWNELSRRLSESGAPTSCLDEVRTRLRNALEIPGDWK